MACASYIDSPGRVRVGGGARGQFANAGIECASGIQRGECEACGIDHCVGQTRRVGGGLGETCWFGCAETIGDCLGGGIRRRD